MASKRSLHLRHANRKVIALSRSHDVDSHHIELVDSLLASNRSLYLRDAQRVVTLTDPGAMTETPITSCSCILSWRGIEASSSDTQGKKVCNSGAAKKYLSKGSLSAPTTWVRFDKNVLNSKDFVSFQSVSQYMCTCFGTCHIGFSEKSPSLLRRSQCLCLCRMNTMQGSIIFSLFDVLSVPTFFFDNFLKKIYQNLGAQYVSWISVLRLVSHHLLWFHDYHPFAKQYCFVFSLHF